MGEVDDRGGPNLLFGIFPGQFKKNSRNFSPKTEHLPLKEAGQDVRKSQSIIAQPIQTHANDSSFRFRKACL